MPNPQSELRIFISSTFHDLQEEREYLVKKVFPQIRQLCRERGVEFTEIDLRWGLTEEEATHGKIIRTCLEEIDRCRPYFIGIIGERYGWSPKFHEVQKDAELIRKYPWIEDASADGASIIDMEFQYGVLQDPSHAYGAYFYFRKAGAEAPKDQNIKKLEALKKRTRASRRPVKEFVVAAELGELVRADLTKLIELHWHKDSIQSPLDAERASHEAFASTRRRAYILNPDYLNAFNRFIDSDLHTSPFVISGISGIGKSSLMAYLAHSYERRNPDAFIVSHYIGASTSTSDHSGLLRHICLEIKDRLNLQEEIPSTTEELTKEFSNWLAKVQDEKLIIFLDALNQLEGNLINLAWLPSYIPPNIAVICSTTEGPSLVSLRERTATEIELKPLSDEERESIIVRFLGEYHKGLSQAQSRLIAFDPKSAIPLFLRTTLEELRLVGNFEEIDQHINYYLAAEDLDDLFKKVLERMENDYGASLVEEFMTLLWSSRRGLSEAELLDLLAVSSVTPDNQPVTRLDLSLLLNALDYHLIRKDGLLSFFHNYLRNAVEKRYLESKEKQNSLHSKLGKYFTTLSISKRRTDEEPWQWQSAEAWEDFKNCLTDIPMLERLLDEERLYELIGYWLKLRDHFDPSIEHTKAMEALEETKPDPEYLASVYSKLGTAFQIAGSYEPAEQYLKHALDIRRAIYPSTDARVAESMCILGNLLRSRGRFDEAEVLLIESLDIYIVNYGEENIKTSDILENTAALYYDQGDLDDSEALYKRALHICENLLGNNDKKTISIISNLAVVYLAQSDLEKAEAFARKSLFLNEKVLGINHPATATDINNLAAILIRKEDYAHAIPMVKRSIEINKYIYGPLHPEIASNYNNLAYLSKRMGDIESAIQYYNLALYVSRKVLTEEHPDTAKYMYNLAQSYRQEKQYEQANELHSRSFSIRSKLLGVQNIDTRNSLSRILEGYQAAESPTELSEFFHLLKKEGVIDILEKNSLYYADQNLVRDMLQKKLELSSSFFQSSNNFP